ncbi:MAG: hypothetical protein E6J00_01210 [Chloroflexi bacterium]|nr:MAG: hypothetical protein E6J00_01210 [Chloroflexota bacterium]
MIDEGLVATEFEVERNRRGFLGWLGKIGIGTVGGVAGLMTTTTAAAACCSYRCCCLNYCPPNCPINSSGYYYCKSGYTMHSWTCCSGSPPFQRLYACGECVPNGVNTCYSSSYCSALWTVRPNSC